MNWTERNFTPPIPSTAPDADVAVWELSDRWGYDRDWRNSINVKLPERFALKLSERYREDWEKNGSYRANSRLRRASASAPLLKSGLPLSSDEDDIFRQAKFKAGHCFTRARQCADYLSAYKKLAQYTRKSGLEPPSISASITPKGAVKRMCHSSWWRRRLRAALGIAIETGSIQGGFVHKKRSPYVSSENIERKREQNQRNQLVLEGLIAFNELGESYSLIELAELSNANPVIRRCELMARLAGYELYADKEGYSAYFVTLTCPSRFHARFGRSGDQNPNYDGSTPKEAQAYLNKIWQRVRARWKDHGIKAFGVRVVEPHHDGTPHWHILIFLKDKDRDLCLDFLKNYSFKESPDEPGAREHRFKVKDIDKSKGSAVGYVAKYISKNVDGYGLEADELGRCTADTAERVRVWASTWGIRQFQDFGGPPVSVWREFRKIRTVITEYSGLERARLAADSGDWAGFIVSMGGVCINRADRPISLFKIWSDKLNSYEEPMGEVIFGVEMGGVSIITRIHVWTVSFKSLGDEAPDAAGFDKGAWRSLFTPSDLNQYSGQRPDHTNMEFCQ